MKSAIGSPAAKHSSGRSRLFSSVAMGSLLIVLVLLFLPEARRSSERASNSSMSNGQIISARFQRNDRVDAPAVAVPAASAEEIVASKVSQFARERRRIVEAMARRFRDSQ